MTYLLCNMYKVALLPEILPCSAIPTKTKGGYDRKGESVLEADKRRIYDSRK